MRLPDSWKNARVTMAIAVVTAAVWLLLALFRLDEWAAIGGGFIPARLAYGGGEGLLPFWLTPLTSAFLHVNFAHLAFNLLMLVFCGRPVEAVLGPIGMALSIWSGPMPRRAPNMPSIRWRWCRRSARAARSPR